MALLRLQKILAQAGVASRRKAEELISAGRVRVDGRIVTELGVKAEPDARVEVDGQRVMADRSCYGVLNKPRGMVTTMSDPEGRKSVHELLRQVGMRVVPVGRLDFNTSGVLLFTNDGDFAQALTAAKTRVPKVYLAKVRGELDEQGLERWAQKIEIDGRFTEPANVRLLRRERGHTWLEITLHEGRNRQVRRLGEHAGSSVVRLTRLSHAGIELGDLPPGDLRLLTVDELTALKKAYGVPQKIRGAVTFLSGKPAPRRTAISRTARAGRTSERSGERSEGRVAGGPGAWKGARSPGDSFGGAGTDERPSRAWRSGSAGGAGTDGRPSRAGRSGSVATQGSGLRRDPSESRERRPARSDAVPARGASESRQQGPARSDASRARGPSRGAAKGERAGSGRVEAGVRARKPAPVSRGAAGKERGRGSAPAGAERGRPAKPAAPGRESDRRRQKR